MNLTSAARTAALMCAGLVAIMVPCLAQTVQLPAGIKAVWNLDQAYRETTPTRERLCLNGLWRWQPAGNDAATVPAENWGFFKVPGPWPGRSDWMQKDCQTAYPHPTWKDTQLADISAAWYQREITIPPEWAGRRIALQADYLNSYAAVYVDGQKAGELRFPGGELDLTAVCQPGRQHLLSLLVVAMPLKGVMMSYNDTSLAKEVQGSVERRGLCGDVYLSSTPAGPRLTDVKVDTSVRKWEISCEAALQGLTPGTQYALEARVTDQGRLVKQFTSQPFTAADLKQDRFTVTAPWHPTKLWDTITPQNMVHLSLSLREADGKALDVAAPVRFGFREFWISGRDFYLNGTRIFLSTVPLDNAQISAAAATYEATRESLRRLKSFGVNFVYTHNYGCEPGTHLSFAEVLRAADDVGMLVALAQPHFGQYDWQAPDADQTNGYARHAEFYVRIAENHPAIVMYAMSHNATGYIEDMNPDMIDGVQDPRPDWAKNGIKPALRAQAIVSQMDPQRIVYHHSSGNLGAMHTNNFYPNFVPIQEMSDWFEHWATTGVKPLFLCEFAAPCTWDFTMYRGWYQGGRTFGSATVPWELCLAEWNSQFFGDQAFRLTEVEKSSLRWEAARFRTGNLWHRWDYPHQIGTTDYAEQYPVLARYITDEWRAFRTWGISNTNPWEYETFWKPRPGLKRDRQECQVDWDHLQRPGFSPDYVDQRYERIDLAFQPSDWIPSPAAEAVLRNNQPLLAYIGGKPAAFTSKDHNFVPGETVEKQLIIINNSRLPVTADCKWSLGLPRPVTGTQKATLATGQQARLPLRFKLPTSLAPGKYELVATFRFSKGSTQQDRFTIQVLPPAPPVPAKSGIALFDPKGETGKLLSGLGVRCQPVDAAADLSGYDTLVIGKAALTAGGPGPDLSRVRQGLKVIVFEQTAEALEKRLGFRVAEYGLRQVFARVPDHAALAGLPADGLRDWRGEATILPPRLKYEVGDAYQYTTPTVKWCDLDVPRLWRCGCRGNVASVLIEKPVRGDFLPLLDGGYSLQYSPLLEYREGTGLVMFCQLDVTGRTEGDPAAQALTRNLLRYVATWQPSPRRTTLYAGDPAGKRHLQRAGLAPAAYDGGKLSPDQVLVVGAGAGQTLAASAPAVADFLQAGGHLLALGLDEQEANAFLPSKVTMKPAEHIAAFFPPPAKGTALTGVGPADVHNRAPRQLPLVTGGADVVGDGVLATAQGGRVVFWQLPPHTLTSAEGAVAAFAVDDGDALEGRQSALVTMGTATEAGGQFGQAVKVAAEAGKTYTFAVSVKAVGGPVAVHLEIERAGSPWDRAVKTDPVPVPEGKWTEVHVTFRCQTPFPQGWQAYLGCAQDGGRFRADMFQLYEGDYVPWQPGAPGPPNLITNPGFEDGREPWWFNTTEQYNLRRTYRRASFTLTRLLANMGAAGATPLLDRFGTSVPSDKPEQRWLQGMYLDEPEAWDDPYRFFCW
jgi:beta-galactosidase